MAPTASPSLGMRTIDSHHQNIAVHSSSAAPQRPTRPRAVAVFRRSTAGFSETTRIAVRTATGGIVLSADGHTVADADWAAEAPSAEQLYRGVAAVGVEEVLAGGRASFIACGQSGSGKSSSLFFLETNEGARAGLLPRAAMHLFAKLPASCEVRLSFIELYNDSWHDLLPRSGPIKLREVPGTSAEVSGVNLACRTGTELIEAVREAETRRHIGPRPRLPHTLARSHRAHAVVTVRVNFMTGDNATRGSTGMLTVVDLAGPLDPARMNAAASSMDAATSPKLRGDVLQALEGRSINASLYALGEVVRCLTTLPPTSAPGKTPVTPNTKSPGGAGSSRESRVPVRWRDAKLTRMLQGPLGAYGNCVVLAHCRLERRYVDELKSTLRFASRCRQMKLSLELEPPPVSAAMSNAAAAGTEVGATAGRSGEATPRGTPVAFPNDEYHPRVPGSPPKCRDRLSTTPPNLKLPKPVRESAATLAGTSMAAGDAGHVPAPYMDTEARPEVQQQRLIEQMTRIKAAHTQQVMQADAHSLQQRALLQKLLAERLSTPPKVVGEAQEVAEASQAVQAGAEAVQAGAEAVVASLAAQAQLGVKTVRADAEAVVAALAAQASAVRARSPVKQREPMPVQSAASKAALDGEGTATLDGGRTQQAARTPAGRPEASSTAVPEQRRSHRKQRAASASGRPSAEASSEARSDYRSEPASDSKPRGRDAQSTPILQTASLSHGRRTCFDASADGGAASSAPLAASSAAASAELALPPSLDPGLRMEPAASTDPSPPQPAPPPPRPAALPPAFGPARGACRRALHLEQLMAAHAFEPEPIVFPESGPEAEPNPELESAPVPELVPNAPAEVRDGDAPAPARSREPQKPAATASASADRVPDGTPTYADPFGGAASSLSSTVAGGSSSDEWPPANHGQLPPRPKSAVSARHRTSPSRASPSRVSPSRVSPAPADLLASGGSPPLAGCLTAQPRSASHGKSRPISAGRPREGAGGGGGRRPSRHTMADEFADGDDEASDRHRASKSAHYSSCSMQSPSAGSASERSLEDTHDDRWLEQARQFVTATCALGDWSEDDQHVLPRQASSAPPSSCAPQAGSVGTSSCTTVSTRAAAATVPTAATIPAPCTAPATAIAAAVAPAAATAAPAPAAAVPAPATMMPSISVAATPPPTPAAGVPPTGWAASVYKWLASPLQGSVSRASPSLTSGGYSGPGVPQGSGHVPPAAEAEEDDDEDKDDDEEGDDKPPPPPGQPPRPPPPPPPSNQRGGGGSGGGAGEGDGGGSPGYGAGEGGGGGSPGHGAGSTGGSSGGGTSHGSHAGAGRWGAEGGESCHASVPSVSSRSAEHTSLATLGPHDALTTESVGADHASAVSDLATLGTPERGDRMHLHTAHAFVGDGDLGGSLDHLLGASLEFPDAPRVLLPGRVAFDETSVDRHSLHRSGSSSSLLSLTSTPPSCCTPSPPRTSPLPSRLDFHDFCEHIRAHDAHVHSRQHTRGTLRDRFHELVQGADGRVEASLALRVYILEALGGSSFRVIEMLRVWDVGMTRLVGRRELGRAVRALGLNCSRRDVEAVFDVIDADGAGSLSHAAIACALRSAPLARAKLALAAVAARADTALADEAARSPAASTGPGGTGPGSFSSSTASCRAGPEPEPGTAEGGCTVEGAADSDDDEEGEGRAGEEMAGVSAFDWLPPLEMSKQTSPQPLPSPFERLQAVRMALGGAAAQDEATEEAAEEAEGSSTGDLAGGIWSLAGTVAEAARAKAEAAADAASTVAAKAAAVEKAAADMEAVALGLGRESATPRAASELPKPQAPGAPKSRPRGAATPVPRVASLTSRPPPASSGQTTRPNPRHMTTSELRATLKAKGVPFSPAASRKALEALLNRASLHRPATTSDQISIRSAECYPADVSGAACLSEAGYLSEAAACRTATEAMAKASHLVDVAESATRCAVAAKAAAVAAADGVQLERGAGSAAIGGALAAAHPLTAPDEMLDEMEPGEMTTRISTSLAEESPVSHAVSGGTPTGASSDARPTGQIDDPTSAPSQPPPSHASTPVMRGGPRELFPTNSMSSASPSCSPDATKLMLATAAASDSPASVVSTVSPGLSIYLSNYTAGAAPTLPAALSPALSPSRDLPPRPQAGPQAGPQTSRSAAAAGAGASAAAPEAFDSPVRTSSTTADSAVTSDSDSELLTLAATLSFISSPTSTAERRRTPTRSLTLPRLVEEEEGEGEHTNRLASMTARPGAASAAGGGGGGAMAVAKADTAATRDRWRRAYGCALLLFSAALLGGSVIVTSSILDPPTPPARSAAGWRGAPPMEKHRPPPNAPSMARATHHAPGERPPSLSAKPANMRAEQRLAPLGESAMQSLLRERSLWYSWAL